MAGAQEWSNTGDLQFPEVTETHPLPSDMRDDGKDSTQGNAPFAPTDGGKTPKKSVKASKAEDSEAAPAE